MAELAVSILAGGKNSRMGTPKGLLPIDGESLISRILARTLPLAPVQRMIITNDPASYAGFGVELYPDIRPGYGPLGGIEAALHHTRASHCLIVACDMPFLSSDLLALLWDTATTSDADAVVPAMDGTIHGLHAIYCRSCLSAVSAHLDQGDRSVVSFFPDVRVHFMGRDDLGALDHPDRSLTNVNTPAELDTAIALAQSTHQTQPSRNLP
jgi:molybdenum cofactor guanylyltransferase